MEVYEELLHSVIKPSLIIFKYGTWWFVYIWLCILPHISWVHKQFSTSDMSILTSMQWWFISAIHLLLNKLCRSHVSKDSAIVIPLTLSYPHLEVLYQQLTNLSPHVNMLRIIFMFFTFCDISSSNLCIGTTDGSSSIVPLPPLLKVLFFSFNCPCKIICNWWNLEVKGIGEG